MTKDSSTSLRVTHSRRNLHFKRVILSGTKVESKNLIIQGAQNKTISTKGRYALRIIIDLAENDNGTYIPMKQVAQRQRLSLKYLEHILSILKQNNIVEGLHGKGGGYKLTRKPEEYTVGEILRIVEGDLAPVSCLECGATPCENAEHCRTLEMWKG
ncbi:MAG: Rrf2 family transcriptional regulator, partial [Clostridia bacterium]|nr:Rrf2 family transcriptional regulator [Clostridia bacterium]